MDAFKDRPIYRKRHKEKRERGVKSSIVFLLFYGNARFSVGWNFFHGYFSVSASRLFFCIPDASESLKDIRNIASSPIARANK